MRLILTTAILLARATAGIAQDRIADTLRNGILEEDSKQNLAAAIAQYRTVLTQYSEARQAAATALFRLAECYRKQGDRTRAIESYARVLKEFPDQPEVSGPSRTILRTTYNVTDADQSDAKKRAGAQTRESKRVAEARDRYRAIIEQEVVLTAKQWVEARRRRKAGTGTDAEVAEAERKLNQLKRDLAAFDAGIPPRQGR